MVLRNSMEAEGQGRPRQNKIRYLARNGYTYAFWAINRYTARFTPEKASWRRLIFGLRPIVTTNGSNGQGAPTVSYSTSVSPTFGFNCTCKWLERSLLPHSNIDSGPHEMTPLSTSWPCLSTQTPEKTTETARTQVTPETTQVTHSSELHTNPRIRASHICSRSSVCLVFLWCPSSILQG